MARDMKTKLREARFAIIFINYDVLGICHFEGTILMSLQVHVQFLATYVLLEKQALVWFVFNYDSFDSSGIINRVIDNYDMLDFTFGQTSLVSAS